jgi:hypothetical protein
LKTTFEKVFSSFCVPPLFCFRVKLFDPALFEFSGARGGEATLHPGTHGCVPVELVMTGLREPLAGRLDAAVEAVDGIFAGQESLDFDPWVVVSAKVEFPK